MIESDAQLAEILRALNAAPTLGIDTEGDGLYRYRGRLCTVQIAHGSGIAIVDALCVDLNALAPILGRDGPEKVFHDCAFDARMLAKVGLPLGRVFDTAVAARFLGEVATGLSALLSKYFAVQLPKEFQQADWGRRPLSEEELAYLRDDVRHLLDLAELFKDRCREHGILEEVLVESDWAATEIEDEPWMPAWARVKGAGDLRTGAQRAVLREIAAVREEIAESVDAPAHRVLANPLLITLARRAPRERTTLTRMLGKRSAEHVDRVLSAIERGMDVGDVPEEEMALFRPEPPPRPARQRRRLRETLLAEWRSDEARSRGVGIQVVLPGHALRALAGRGAESLDDLRAIPGFGECRVERYGNALLNLMITAETDG